MATRNLPDTIDTAPPGPDGATYADAVAAEVEALWNGVVNALTGIGGSGNAITAVCDPPLIDDYVHGQTFWLIPDANNTGAATIDIDFRGAVDIVDFAGAALVEDDLVAGQGVMLVYDADLDDMRLAAPTARAIAAIAAAAASNQAWELIGDSGSLGTVAQVEFTFTAGRYGRIVVVAGGMVRSAGVVGVQISLRNAGGAIVTVHGTQVNSAEVRTYRAEFVVDVVSATKRHYGGMAGGGAAESGGVTIGGDVVDNFVNVGGSSTSIREAAGSHATAADRVRVAFANNSGAQSGNITAGRVIAYGMRAP